MIEHTFLFVDDEQNILCGIKRLLSWQPFNILTATSAEKGLEILASNNIQAVISDFRMPGMNGVDFMKQVKNLYPDTVRIILSGYADIDSILEAINHGEIYRFITKPWNDDDLKVTISQSIEVYELAHTNKELNSKIKAQNIALKSANELLEKKVKERTASLTEAYQNLTVKQDQLLEAEKLASIGQLAAGVAHEINNPIGFIKSNLDTLHTYVSAFKKTFNAYQMLETELQAQHDCQKLLSDIAELKKNEDIDFALTDVESLITESIEGATRVKNIVQSLQNFANADVEDSVEADLNECIDKTLNLCANEISKKCHLVKKFSDLPKISCYPNQLKQVFMNLIMNSIHAMQADGKLTIETQYKDSRIILIFSDTGHGIA